MNTFDLFVKLLIILTPTFAAGAVDIEAQHNGDDELLGIHQNFPHLGPNEASQVCGELAFILAVLILMLRILTA